MKVEKIDHVALTVRGEDFEKAIQFFSDVFETEFGETSTSFEYESKAVVDNRIGLELSAPLTPEGKTGRILAKHGGDGAVTLLSFKVPKMSPAEFDQAIEKIQSRGVRVIDKGTIQKPAEFGGGTFQHVVFHPKDTFGVMIELTDNDMFWREIT